MNWPSFFPDMLNSLIITIGATLVTVSFATLAIVLAVLLIAWARVEIHGTADLAALAEDEAPRHSTISNGNGGKAAENEAASSRWATGFSH